MRKTDLTTRDITYIAFGVVAMIAGGAVVLSLSMVFPIPGAKYILMAPWLSMVVSILLAKVRRRHVLALFGTVFGLIMSAMNLYMGLAIVMTGLLSDVSSLPFKEEAKPFFGGVFFAGYTGLTALAVSKFMIGGAFAGIPLGWLAATGLLCALFGLAGALMARKVMKHLVLDSYSS